MRTLLFVVAVLAIAIPAHADDPCYTTSTPTATIPDATHQAGGDVYVMVDACNPTVDCFFSFWIYQESNGIPGLQRGDAYRSDVASCNDGTVSDAGSLF